jgi:FkbM family methyltransferase
VDGLPNDPASGARFPEQASPDRVCRFNLHGIHLEMPRSALTPDVWATLVRGNYETEEIHCLTTALQPGDTMLELGAGIGFMSSYAVRRCHAGRVIALEANPGLIPVIRRTLALNGVVAEVVHGVVAREDGEATFNVSRDFWSSSAEPSSNGEPIRLRAIGLPGLLAAMRRDVLMVDIEGGEAKLFNGVDLTGVRCVVVELHQLLTGLAGVADRFSATATAGFAYDPMGSNGPIVTFRRR